MPRLRIIILDHDDRNYNYLLWADAPVARQTFYANPAKVSEWRGALADDNAKLQSGEVVEASRSRSFHDGETLAQIRTALVAESNKFQTYITNHNPWDRYGTTFDGTTWVNGGIA